MQKLGEHPRDVRGTPIKETEIVAYNLSGDVAIGVVTEVVRSWRRATPGWTIRVRLLHDCAWKDEGHYSEIRNVGSVIVLLKGDTPL